MQDKTLIKQAVEEKINFVKRCGLKLVELADHHVTCMMPGKGNENHLGNMYAGALFTLAEIPGGALWLANFDISKTYPILKSFTIDFKKPAAGDIFFTVGLEADMVKRLSEECLEQGKAEFILQGELKNAEGKVVALSKGVYQLRRH